ncbi:MAG: endolytic transglycosylase MltG [Thermodesulfobacteriota bacterium]
MITFLHRHKTFLIAVGLLWVSLFSIYWFFLSPPSGPATTKTVMIKKGTPLRKVLIHLQEEGIIRDASFFMGMTTLLGKKKEIKAGEYEFHTRMYPWQVLNLLATGQTKYHLLTIPEGLTLSQIAQLLEDLNLAEKKTFLEKAFSPRLLLSLGLPYSVASKSVSSVEGYLYPNTYHLMKEMSPEEIIQIMVQQFQRVFNRDWIQRASQLGMSQREVVILASIIEKEASLPEEKPIVSAVFHNRLKKKMPLQSDPTVIYGMKNFNGNLTRADLERPSPYNTYLFNGLPPTPICNPGKEAILAALYPSPVSYLYFVSRNDGSHHFSSTIEEHNRAVWKYQKGGLNKASK